jgi:hypothetical protein
MNKEALWVFGSWAGAMILMITIWRVMEYYL